MYPALWRVGKVVVVLLGLLMFAGLVSVLVEGTRLFLDPRYSNFWDEVEAYHLKPEERRPREQLVAQYGFKPVNQYMLTPGLQAAYLPSEQAAMANLVAYLLGNTTSGAAKEHDTPLIVSGFLSSLIVLYVPMVVAARQVQRILTAIVCRSAESRRARQEYFDTVKQSGTRWALAAAFVAAVGISAASAFLKLTPEMEARGINAIDLTAALVWLGYLSGLWLLLLSYVVDVVLLAAGKNPHRSLWDEVVALAVMVPVLYFVYQNSWTAIGTSIVTGLAGGFFAKHAALRRG